MPTVQGVRTLHHGLQQQWERLVSPHDQLQEMTLFGIQKQFQKPSEDIGEMTSRGLLNMGHGASERCGDCPGASSGVTKSNRCLQPSDVVALRWYSTQNMVEGELTHGPTHTGPCYSS